MNPEIVPFLTLGVLLVAFLYSAVGHAGASGYIAVMALFSVAPSIVKPTALALNILVASLASYQFWRAGHFSCRLFWPFGLVAMPMAFLGGYLNLPANLFNMLVGLVLLASAARLLLKPPAEAEPQAPSKPAALTAGGALGLLAGFTGTGGGIFLTPLLIFMRWAHTKTAAATSAVFILGNSVAGLAGNLSATQQIPGMALPLVGAVALGGGAGAWLGSRKLPHTAIKRLLAAVLGIAGLKLIFT
jgi:uncharacterized membrane protein YfcA